MTQTPAKPQKCLRRSFSALQSCEHGLSVLLARDGAWKADGSHPKGRRLLRRKRPATCKTLRVGCRHEREKPSCGGRRKNATWPRSGPRGPPWRPRGCEAAGLSEQSQPLSPRNPSIKCFPPSSSPHGPKSRMKTVTRSVCAESTTTEEAWPVSEPSGSLCNVSLTLQTLQVDTLTSFYRRETWRPPGSKAGQRSG